MIQFPTIRTSRLTVKLHELSLLKSIELANIPEDRIEQACTHLLMATTKLSVNCPPVKDWTAQERIFVLCNYLSTVFDDPDFAIGDQAHFFDYLGVAGDVDFVADPVVVGEVGGDKWMIRHLTGTMAEAIERRLGDIYDIHGRSHWLLGCMAAQLYRDGEEPSSTDNEGDFDDVLVERAKVFANYPDSDFQELLLAFYRGREKLKHIFDLDIDHKGIVVLPKEGAEGDLPPARFRAHLGLSAVAAEMAEKTGIDSP